MGENPSYRDLKGRDMVGVSYVQGIEGKIRCLGQPSGEMMLGRIAGLVPKSRVSSHLASLGHTGRRIVLGHT